MINTAKGYTYYDELSKQGLIEQLQQLTNLTSDGDLIDKSQRDQLVRLGYATRVQGWNIINIMGIQYLQNGGFIHR